MHFLMGLNKTYSSIRGQILLTNLFPAITQVFSLVVQEEKQKEISASTSSNFSHAFAVKNTSDLKNKADQKDRPTYAHCGI